MIPVSLINIIRNFIESDTIKNLVVKNENQIPIVDMERYGFRLVGELWAIDKDNAKNLYGVYLSTIRSARSIFQADKIRYKIMQNESK